MNDVKNVKFGLTIGAKLIGLIAVLLILSVTSIVAISTKMFSEDNAGMIQQMNADKAAALSLQMRESLDGLTEKMRVLGTTLVQDVPNKDQITKEFFNNDKGFLGVLVFKQPDGPGGLADNSKNDWNVIQSSLSPGLKTGDIDAAKIFSALSAEKEFQPKQVANGDIQITPFTFPDNTTAVAVSIPFIQSPTQPGTFTHTLTAILKQDQFAKVFSESDIVNTYMVDKHGRLIAHSDQSRVAAHENVSGLDIIKLLLEGKTNNQQTRYFDPQSNEWKLGAYKMVGFGGLGVVAEVAEAKAFEAAIRVKYRSILIAFIVLCISFLTGYLYSGTITRPIKQLVEAARRISAGDFKINLKAKGHDEVAKLSVAFNEMAQGLEERDRVKETFNKFHNKEIADKLLSGEVKLGGERKEATVFFSDVRGFTGLSESMEPEQVVEMLNEYMTRMVSIIRAHHGIVDKYVGDAIMALWGVPISQESDVKNAVRACIAMREDLSKLNDLRISRGQPVLKIGMGLNTGPLIAGNIGSNEKMEYTVIGDAVNLASRIESMTKEYGTDLLISKRVCEQVKDNFIFETCKTAKVKGKSNAIEVFKVKGYYDENRQSVIVETPYSSYAAEKSDKVVHEPSSEPVAAELPSQPPVVEAVAEVTPPPIEIPPLPETSEEKDVTTFLELPPVAEAVDIPEASRILVRELPPVPEPAIAPVLEENVARTVDLNEPTIEPVATATAQQPSTPPPFVPKSAEPEKTATIFRRIKWYLNYGSEALGPFTRKEVIAGINDGEFSASTLCSKYNDGPWTPLGETREFKSAVHPGEPKVAA